MYTTIKSLCLVFFIMINTILNIHAQEDNKKKQQKDGFKEFLEKEKEKYKDFREQEENQFKAFAEKEDEKFAEFLKEHWKEFRLFAGIQPDTIPKIIVAPIFSPDEITSDIYKELKQEHTLDLADNAVTQTLVMPFAEADDFDKLQGNIYFYGSSLEFEFDKNLNVDINTEINENAISEYWNKMYETKYSHLIDQLLDYKLQMNLNDWGYYLLIQKVAKNIISGSENSKKLFAWFILSKSRYKAKIAYKDNKIYLLLPAINQIYNTPYYTFNGINYYLIDANEENVFTYEFEYSYAVKIMDLNIKNSLFFEKNIAEKQLFFNYNGNAYTFNIKYNTNITDFYKSYPQTELSIYFDAAVSTITKESIIENLLPLVQERQELDAVNLLLSFVQNSFEYKDDKSHFGKEKFYFPEEMLNYDYSDCEDRSVLFAYLVKELLNLETIGLDFPGHAAVGVKFSDDVDGDFVIHNNKKFIVCDPTFINAPVGNIIPEYKGQPVSVIELENTEQYKIKRNKIWDKILLAGGNPGYISKNTVIDKQGNNYVTGYFSGEVTFGKFKLKSGNNFNDVFFAKFDKHGNTVWAKQSIGTGNDIAYTINNALDGNFYIMGSFDSTIVFDDYELQTNGNLDFFITKFDKNGNIIWINKAGIDTISKDEHLDFISYFDLEGNHLWTKLYDDSEFSQNYEIITDTSGCFIKASLSSSITLVSIDKAYLDYGKYYNAKELVSEYEKLITYGYEKSIAGLFAMINLIKNKNAVISGKSAQEAFDKANPELKKKNEEFYKNLGKIQYLKNSNGIISIITDNKEPVIFKKVKINNNSKITLEFLKNGNVKLIATSGIKVGKYGVYPFKLNYIQLFKDNGLILFNYDEDHSLVIVPVRPDILD